MRGQNFGFMRNKVCSEVLQNENIIKALIIEADNFLDVTPTTEQQQYIDNPIKLMRNYLYPYKRNFDTAVEKKTMLTTEFSNFNKMGKNYRNGLVTFYILVPVDFENTSYGIRYDYIGDELENVFNNTTIGEFSFNDRGDIEIGNRYIGHYVSFRITEFHIE